MKSGFYLICYVLIACYFTSCNDDDALFIPKPKGYMYQTFPEKKYAKYDTTCPYTFQYPKYSLVVYDKSSQSEPCWLDIVFPQYKAVIYISYKNIKTNADLLRYIEENRTYTIKHQVKATSMKEQVVKNLQEKVYGMVYTVGGNTASSCQFYLTDSVRHFVRASLYFNVKPNEDSLKPSLDFIKADIDYFVKTFRWK
jgi:gliding motility-associated lipoprotein GldD